MPDSLRGQILRLAAEDDDLRPRLVAFLREAGGLSEEEEQVVRKANQPQPIVIQQVVNSGPVVPQANPTPPVGIITSPFPAPAPVAPAPVADPAPALTPNQAPSGVPSATVTPVNVLGVPERAQQGFNAELKPEMERLLAQGVPRTQVGANILAILRDSFAKKDALYNVLIRYQSSFEGNEAYLGNLESLIEAWATSNNGV